MRGRVEVGGRPGVLMERLEGPNLLEETSRRPWRMGRLAGLLGNVHAQLHEIEAPAGLPGLCTSLTHRLGSRRVPGEVRETALRLLRGLPDGEREGLLAEIARLERRIDGASGTRPG